MDSTQIGKIEFSPGTTMSAAEMIDEYRRQRRRSWLVLLVGLGITVVLLVAWISFDRWVFDVPTVPYLVVCFIIGLSSNRIARRLFKV